MDQGSRWTDRYIKMLEGRITETYAEAQRDIEAKIEDFERKFEAKNNIHKQDVKSGKWTQEQYDSWLAGQAFQSRQWQIKRDQIIQTMANANQIATKIANEQRGNVFVENSNYQAFLLESGAGVNFGFGLYDSSAVAKLIRNYDGQILPMWKVDEPKDYIWNTRVVNNAITQGIIQGEGLEKIAKRLSDGLVTKNRNKMLTFARTGMTQAQNAGRVQRLDEAEKMGIKVHKEWVATLDERTRTAHQILDGKKVPINKPFKVDNYEINYPGDPTAHPSMIYNCRCTLVGDLDDYPSEFKRYDNINGRPIEGMTYTEWKNAKKSAGESTEKFVESPRSTLIESIMKSYTTRQMTEEQKTEFRNLVLNNMSDENLELYNAMTEFHGDSNCVDGSGWYVPSKHRVEMTLTANKWERTVGKSENYAWKTKFHEELHQLDHILGITQGYGPYSDISACEFDLWQNSTPVGERLGAAIETDITNFMNNAIGYYNDEHGSKVSKITDINKPINKKAKEAFFEYLDLTYGNDGQSKASISAFTDAVGLFTGDRISPYSAGYWGHPPKYNKDRGPNGATSECFAEIGSHIMRNDQESLDILREVMPTSVGAYESAIHEFAEFVKTMKIHY